jgi:hypothetical protein
MHEVDIIGRGIGNHSITTGGSIPLPPSLVEFATAIGFALGITDGQKHHEPGSIRFRLDFLGMQKATKVSRYSDGLNINHIFCLKLLSLYSEEILF